MKSSGRSRCIDMGILLFLWTRLIAYAWAHEEMQFNSNFLRKLPGQEAANLALFSHRNTVLPGHYLVDVQVNSQYVEQMEIRFDFAVGQTNGHAQPCLTSAMLQRWKIKMAPTVEVKQGCIYLPDFIAYSRVEFDATKQLLSIDVPQIAMQKTANYETSSLWNHGVSAARVNYQLLATRQSVHGVSPDSTFLGMIEAGGNIEAWRFRQRMSYQKNGAYQRWQQGEFYAMRDVVPWRSTLVIGDIFTPGDVFSSVSLRGVQMASETAMLPYDQQGYAPVIRGVAQTSAVVSIKQNGYVVYRTLVSPGPFAITDLSPTIADGDLEVMLTEADGQVRKFKQTHAATLIQLREGAWRYHVAMGQYRHHRKQNIHPWLLQGVATYGVNTYLTAYIGLQAASTYQNLTAGMGLNLQSWGASSLDWQETYSSYKNHQNSRALRFQYAQNYPSTQTNSRFAAYLFSEKFRSFSEHVDCFGKSFLEDRFTSPRMRFDFNISQALGMGNLNAQWQIKHFLSGHVQQQAQISYTQRFKNISYGIHYSHYLKAQNARHDSITPRQLSLSLTIPIDRVWGGKQNTFLNYTANSAMAHTLNLSGDWGDKHLLSYHMSMRRTQTQAQTLDMGIQLRPSYADIAVSHSANYLYHATSLAWSGGIVIHPGGFTFSPPLSDTIALINTRGVQGVQFIDFPKIQTDRYGYAVLPYIAPYQKNRLILKTETLPENIEVKTALVEVIPTKGAIAQVNYTTQVGYKIVLVAKNQEGHFLPLGARVENMQGQEIALVGMRGQIYLTGAPATATLIIKTGVGATTHCHLSYALPLSEASIAPKINTLGIFNIKSVCTS